jgi:ATP-dependent helicase HrpB
VTTLPIHGVLPQILAALDATQCCILQASPGAGKTTVVPLELLNTPWLHGNRIVMLEPRRVAARAAATRMAASLGQAVGDTVGYTIRNDKRTSARTRIEVVTEGILTRRLAANPDLDGVGCVIFDEFHERSLHADTALALTLLCRDLLRPNLHIVVMSATLHAADVLATMIAGSKAAQAIVQSEGRQFPVQTSYLPSPSQKPLPALMASAVRDALAHHEGDVLCFLPGLADIRRAQEALAAARLDDTVDVLPLHSSVDARAQDKALSPAAAGRRKVVLASAIAETSVTLPGVRTVIDAGLAREPRFDARSGLAKLVTVPVTQDAAEQRRGRAGRLGPGTCYRLWTQETQATLAPRRTPEVLVSDLTPLMLDLALFGAEVQDLAWLDAPPAHHVRSAVDLLQSLDALDATGTITPHGRAMALFGTHPRLSHMIVAGRGVGLDANVLAATVHDIEADAVRVNRIQALPSQAMAPSQVNHHACALALAYPDRVARRRADERYILMNGRFANLSRSLHLDAEFIVAVDVEASSANATIRNAVPLTKSEIEWLFSHHIETRHNYGIDEAEQAVVARTARMLGSVVLDERDDPTADEQAISHALAQWIVDREWRDLDWTDSATALVDRIHFAETLEAPITRMEVLARLLPPTTLAAAVRGRRKLRDAQNIDVTGLLRESMTYHQRATLDTVAPTHVVLPAGPRVSIDYSNPAQPVAAAKLQHFFGLRATPTVGNGRVPLTLHLLSPAGRPIQVTQDIAGFWKGSYAMVRKELRGRYPKHSWPEPHEL